MKTDLRAVAITVEMTRDDSCNCRICSYREKRKEKEGPNVADHCSLSLEKPPKFRRCFVGADASVLQPCSEKESEWETQFQSTCREVEDETTWAPGWVQVGSQVRLTQVP